MKKIIFILFCTLAYSFMHAQNKINSYEYWFDNDYISKVSTNITPISNYNLNSIIPTTGLPSGLHTFNIRFKDDSSKYSQVSSSFFFKQYQGSGPTQNDITQYEYWIDNDYASKTIVNITAAQQFNLNTNIATNSTVTGLHVFNIRFKDTGGKWSQVLSQFFYKSATTTAIQNDIVEYEYWYDNNYSSKINSTISPQQQFNLVNNLATPSLPVGLHVMNIRFKDVTGKWSQVLSHFFNKTQSSLSTQKLLTTYQYWYDNDYTNNVTQSIAPVTNYQLIGALPTSTLPSGLHTFNVRFKDTNNLWSQVLSNFIYKTQPIPGGTNVIVAYRYWADNDIASAINVQLPSPLVNFNLNTTFNMLTVPKGARTFNIQFKDTSNKWSVVQSDSFFRTPIPMASFNSTATSFCDSGTVTFNNLSVDADIYHWDFGDGDTSTDASPIHTYLSPGNYTVSLLSVDTLMYLQDDTIQTSFVTVNALPNVVATSTIDTLCFGQSTTLIATGNANSYSWSNGVVNNQSFAPTNSGYYTLSGVTGACTNLDSIYITVHPLPSVSVSTIAPNDTLCNGSSLTLAGGGANTYLWNGPQTITDNNTFIANTSGTYTVTGTDIHSCSNTNTIFIQVNPIPTFSLGNDTSICQGKIVTLSQPYNGATVLWNNNSIYDTLNVSTLGSYFCSVTLNGCSYIDTIQVNIDSLPISKFGYTINNSLLTLTDSATFATTYKWYFGDGDSSTLHSPTHTYSSNGSYVITQIVYNGCGSDTTKQTIEITTGTNDIVTNSILIYPNPTQDILNIDLRKLNAQSVSYYIVDMKGAIIIKDFNISPKDVIQVNLTSCSAGQYLLKVVSDQKQYMSRITVVK